MHEASSVVSSSPPFTRVELQAKKGRFEQLQDRIGKYLIDDPLREGSVSVERGDLEIAREVVRISEDNWLALNEKPLECIRRASRVLPVRLDELDEMLAELSAAKKDSPPKETSGSEQRVLARSSQEAVDQRQVEVREVSPSRGRQLLVGLSVALVALGILAIGTVAFNFKPPDMA